MLLLSRFNNVSNRSNNDCDECEIDLATVDRTNAPSTRTKHTYGSCFDSKVNTHKTDRNTISNLLHVDAIDPSLWLLCYFKRQPSFRKLLLKKIK